MLGPCNGEHYSRTMLYHLCQNVKRKRKQSRKKFSKKDKEKESYIVTVVHINTIFSACFIDTTGFHSRNNIPLMRNACRMEQKKKKKGKSNFRLY